MSVLERTVRGMLETWPEQFSGRYYTLSSFDAVGLHPVRLVGIGQGFKEVGQETSVSERHELDMDDRRAKTVLCYRSSTCGVEWRGSGVVLG